MEREMYVIPKEMNTSNYEVLGTNIVPNVIGTLAESFLSTMNAKSAHALK